ncbi:MAG: response regulator [Actinomycetota bacterium]
MARVMVVDDDPDLLALVEIQLRQHGHLVSKASSGAEALEVIAAKGAPDIAVLDVAMPGMNGFDLLKELRTRDSLKNLPVIFLSARVNPEDVEAGRALDAVYLTKPYVMSALLDTIDQLLKAPAEVRRAN